MLGVVEALEDGRPIALGGPKQRSVLAMLLLEANRVVSTGRLVDGLWGADAPPRALATVQVYVSNLRKALEPDRDARAEPSVLLTRPPGYVLVVDVARIDARRFEGLLAEARSATHRGDPRRALTCLDEALSLWRGAALVEFAFEEFARGDAARLDELRLVATEERVEARLALGDHAELVGELESLVVAHPLRERLWAQLMLALYRDGRQADALRTFARLRRSLGEELGIEPNASLRNLEEAIVLQKPELDWTPVNSGIPSTGKVDATEVLPSGTVTFLFTDLESSTRLWEQHPEEMRAALERHDEILRSAITAHAGHIVKTTGDGLHAVFADAAGALDAAVDAQRALGNAEWGALGELRVRMGIHSGAAEPHGGDYPGPVVNKAARIMDVAHGEQVLISAATAELVRDRQPDGVRLVDLGEHRLRDLSRAERLFQVRAAGLRETFPPLSSLDSLPNNLPVQLTSFIGRESEMTAVADTLKTNRLVTLTGSAGCGKTRLALQVGAELLERYPDGVWLVELAQITDPGMVLSAIAASLSVRDSSASGAGLGGASDPVAARPIEEVLIEYLRSRRSLVVLDNCEHLLGVCASFVAGALRECAGVRILATSREPLGVEGEATRRVPSLTVPDPSGVRSLEGVLEYEAVRLFLDRAELRAATFSPGDDDALALAQISCRLDGIPLAIELAAARVKVLSPTDIAKRLNDRFQLLTGGSRTALERHQTLRAAVDWSYHLLTAPERVLLARLTTFAGSFSLEAVETVCTDDAVRTEQVLDLVEHLVDRSLVDAELTAADVRYRLLESIRQYGRERLADEGEVETWRRRHRDFYAEFAAAAQSGLWGPEQALWLNIVATDIDNIRAAIDWSLTRNENEKALRIVTALDSFWIGPLNNHREGLRWLEQCLSAEVEIASASLRARALGAKGNIAFYLGDLDLALEAAFESVALYRNLGNPRGLGIVLLLLAQTLNNFGRSTEAESYCDEAIALGRQTGFMPLLGGALFIKSGNALYRGDYESARAACHEVLASRDHHLPPTVALVLVNVGSTTFAEGQYAAARDWFQEASDVAATTGGMSTLDAAQGLALCALALGDPSRAYEIREEAFNLMPESDGKVPDLFWFGVAADVAIAERDLDQAERLCRLALDEPIPDSRFWVLKCFETLARIAGARNDPERAAVLLGARDTMHEQLGRIPIILDWPPLADTLSVVQAALSRDRFSTCWSTGRALSLEQALAYAVGTIEPTTTSHP